MVRTIQATEYGDANLDRRVDSGDFTLLTEHFGMPGDKGWADADFTGDGTTDSAD